MGSSGNHSQRDAPSPAFLRAFADAAGSDGTLRFDAFVQLALYDPAVGYYRRQRTRVGYAAGTDFFTASTSGPVFGELVAAACTKLLGDRAAHGHTFVEIGAEHPGGILDGVAHPFRGVRTIRLGETLELAGPLVVFSNELFDAQPFRRLRFQRDRWHELGVALHAGTLVETVLAPLAPADESLELPTAAAEGYTIDAPLAAVKLAELIARQRWTGLFVAFDYGKSWRELAEAAPAGTARAYHQHTQSNDLLARPGEQDLTCHVCWDWLSAALARHGFATPQVQSQESFLIHHADAYIARAIVADAARFTPRKQSLMQLLHGAHLGLKFQVLHASR